jgi:hypothetical protein
MTTYKTIDDLPVYHWNKINETGDISYLGGENKKENEKLWQDIQDQFVDTYLIKSDNFIEIFLKKKDIAVQEIEMVLSGDRSLATFINIAKLELEKMTEVKGKKISFNEQVALIEKFMGFQINTKITSVSQFYSYVNLYGKKDK